MSIYDEVRAANDDYAASFGAKGDLALPPARHFAILTCMDARLDPAKYAGLSEGDAHVIRNAGGRASDDAIRSLVISYKLLGTRSGSSSTTPIAAWNSSPTRSSAACWPTASRRPNWARRLSRRRARSRFGRGELHRLADDRRQCGERGRGCHSHSESSPGAGSAS